METGSDKLQRLCSVLMASLFALSASFQFNDPDWYFWIPLYASACIINVVNGVTLSKTNSRLRNLAKFTFWLGLFLFVKVVMEDLGKGIAGFWSIDMRERVVREKLGSWLVVISMLLFPGSSSRPDDTSQVAKYGQGMPSLVIFAYGLSFGFFMFQHDDMRY